MIGAAVQDGECQLDGLYLGVGAERVAFWNAIAVAVYLNLGFV
jgi:hypothetical protein